METVYLHAVFLNSVCACVRKMDMDNFGLVSFDLLAVQNILHILQFSNRLDNSFY